jgi:hypothetical protein
MPGGFRAKLSSQDGVRGDDAYTSNVSGTLFGNFRDSGVCRTTRTGPDVAEFVCEYAREPIGDMRATVIAFWHRIQAGLGLPATIPTPGV